MKDRVAEKLARELPRRRWFRGRGRGIRGVELQDRARLPGGRFELDLVRVRYEGGAVETYFVPLERRGLSDALASPEFCRLAAGLMLSGDLELGERGVFAFRPASRSPLETRRARAALAAPVSALGAEQSNTSAVLGRGLVLKALRRVETGANPGLDIPLFLTERTAFRDLPLVAGHAEYGAAGRGSTVAILQTYVENEGDGWAWTRRRLQAYYGHALRGAALPAREEAASFAQEARRLGALTRRFHEAVASGPRGSGFELETVGRDDVERWNERLRGQAADLLAAVRPELVKGPVKDFLISASTGSARSASRIGWGLLAGRGAKLRAHGDYHLGQILKTPGGWALVDFEGEPLRGLEERRAKAPPLRDAAGMLRSFDYAARTALRPYGREGRRLSAAADDWVRAARRGFLEGYLGGRPPRVVGRLSRDEAERATAAFELEKAVYEALYELRHRPDWVAIPLEALARPLEYAA